MHPVSLKARQFLKEFLNQTDGYKRRRVPHHSKAMPQTPPSVTYPQPRLEGDVIHRLSPESRMELLRKRPLTLPPGESEVEELVFSGRRLRVRWINPELGSITGYVTER